MFVLFNKNLCRYFKHPKSDGIWWTHDFVEAELFIDSIKQFTIEYGLSELVDGLVIQEISDNFGNSNENQKCELI